MFDRVYVHTGSGKTATSSIQGTFTRNLETLERHGIYYVPRPMGALSAVCKQPQRLAPIRAARMTDDAIGTLRDRELEALRAAAGKPALRTAVLSSEHMLPFDRDEVAAVQALLAPLAREVRVLYYARHPHSKIASAFAQRVKSGHCGLDTGIAKFIEPYSGQLRHWIEVFGKARIDVRPFEPHKMPQGSPIADFCAAIGAPEAFAELEIAQANEGISAAAVLIADRLYRHYPVYSDGRGPRDYLNGITGPKFTVPPEVIRSLKPQIDRELAFLEREFGLVLDEPPLREHVDDRNAIFSDAVLESLALALHRQAQEIARLRREIAALAPAGAANETPDTRRAADV
ncbi:hypothetical protein GE300_08495 [Rhodobacteraceae bacterium 2CG4]|uniref:Sulfotransferase family protein n=1 Tax=Halovulum marinum TaxID=2662447 RepID=A0A6L5Z0Q3_9RHOB|nr:hypothetical protein [Halovulum marinum]MSU89655.1 hypothetical protein [Halovulum marinum]